MSIELLTLALVLVIVVGGVWLMYRESRRADAKERKEETESEWKWRQW